MQTKRSISYAAALNEAIDICMSESNQTFVLGQGVNDHAGSFGVTKDLYRKYGDRIQDTPLSEQAIMGVCIGMSALGMRPIYTHNRPDFLYLVMDQLFNHAAKYSYIFGGQIKLSFVVWSCIGGGWGTGGQHSQSNQAMFVHMPGIKVVMPSNAYDAKGLMISSIEDNGPVVFLDHRWVLRSDAREVPEEKYTIPLGKANILNNGNDLTIIGASYMINEALKASLNLKNKFSIEVIDLRCLRPLDTDAIFASVKKTGRLMVVDSGWPRCGVASDLSAIVCENCFHYLKCPIKMISSYDCPTPSSWILENEFYKSHINIEKEIQLFMEKSWQI